MSIRLGVTASEERALKKAIKEGMSWGDIVAAGSKEGEAAILTDVDLDYVKENFYKPLKAQFDADQLAADLDKSPPKK